MARSTSVFPILIRDPIVVPTLSARLINVSTEHAVSAKLCGCNNFQGEILELLIHTARKIYFLISTQILIDEFFIYCLSVYYVYGSFSFFSCHKDTTNDTDLCLVVQSEST